MKDYYSILGVEKSAVAEDIRRAYKKIALKDHPDRNPGDAEAEMRFKMANEAYNTLNDPQKRAQYDRGGVNSSSGGFGGFGGFDDMFAEIFGVRHRGRQQQGPRKGHDVNVQIEISLSDAMKGCKQELNIDIPEKCDPCSGTGSHEGRSFVSCVKCNGSGNVREVMGAMMFSQTCGRCGGNGKTIDKSCVVCNAKGHVSKVKKINVNFPAGINSGNNLKVAGQGHVSPDGGPPGDIYVAVDVKQDKKFKRNKNDLITKLNISLAEAILGAERSITLPDDSAVTFNIPQGSQSNSILTIENKGMPDVRSNNIRGRLHVEIDVEIPRYISEHAKQLIKQFDEEIKRA